MGLSCFGWSSSGRVAAGWPNVEDETSPWEMTDYVNHVQTARTVRAIWRFSGWTING